MKRDTVINILLIIAGIVLAIALFGAGAVWKGKVQPTRPSVLSAPEAGTSMQPFATTDTRARRQLWSRVATRLWKSGDKSSSPSRSLARSRSTVRTCVITSILAGSKGALITPSGFSTSTPAPSPSDVNSSNTTGSSGEFWALSCDIVLLSLSGQPQIYGPS